MPPQQKTPVVSWHGDIRTSPINSSFFILLTCRFSRGFSNTCLANPGGVTNSFSDFSELFYKPQQKYFDTCFDNSSAINSTRGFSEPLLKPQLKQEQITCRTNRPRCCGCHRRRNADYRHLLVLPASTQARRGAAISISRRYDTYGRSRESTRP